MSRFDYKYKDYKDIRNLKDKLFIGKKKEFLEGNSLHKSVWMIVILELINSLPLICQTTLS